MHDSHAAEDTIFAQFDCASLRERLERFAARSQKNVVWGRRGQPDLLAVPAFAVVVDRGSVDAATWSAYVGITEECNAPGEPMPGFEHTGAYESCILVDALRDHAVPRLPVVLQLDPSQPGCAGWLLAAVEHSASVLRGARGQRVNPPRARPPRRADAKRP